MTAPRKVHLAFDIPVVAECDVCIVGGGSSGIAASIAASRAGAHTILVERYGFLGGTSTAGMVGPFMTSYSADGTQRVVGGVFQEMIDRMVELGGAIDPARTEAGSAYSAFIELGHAHVTPFHPEALKLAAMELVQGAGVRILFHTSFVHALLDAERIEGIVVHNKAGLSLIRARNFVDASADADVAANAGVPYSKGRSSDGKMMPATLFMRFGNVDDARLEQYARAHPGERLFEGIVRQARAEGRWDIPREYLNLYREPTPGEYRVNITRLHDIDGTNPDDLSRAEIEGRRQGLAVFRFMKANCPGLENVTLLEMAAQVGIRETRHIQGLYTLTGEDVLAGRRFEDAIARCAYPIDIHDPTGSRGKLIGLGNSAADTERQVKPTAPAFYDIPYRCLVPVRVKNLLVAGRPISATHEAAASARVIPPCYATGQAAGLAAALSVQQDHLVASLDARLLRERLREQGAIV